MPKEYFKKKGQRNKFKMTNPLKQMMDPMLSETAMDPTLGGEVDSAYLYKSPNKQTETEPKLKLDVVRKNRFLKKMEELLAQGFTQEEAEQMIKEGAVTGEVKPEKPEEKSPLPLINISFQGSTGKTKTKHKDKSRRKAKNVGDDNKDYI
jgi:predicted RNase H-like HicB family nuclease